MSYTADFRRRQMLGTGHWGAGHWRANAVAERYIAFTLCHFMFFKKIKNCTKFEAFFISFVSNYLCKYCRMRLCETTIRNAGVQIFSLSSFDYNLLAEALRFAEGTPTHTRLISDERG